MKGTLAVADPGFLRGEVGPRGGGPLDLPLIGEHTCQWSVLGLAIVLKCSFGEPVISYSRVMNVNEMAMALKLNGLHLGTKGTAVCGLDLQ